MPEIYLYIIIGILFFGCVVLAKAIGFARMENEELKLKVMKFEGQQTAFKMNVLLLNSKLQEKPKLTSTTEKLLALAAKSDNAGEAEAAAVKACKRIHKELGYK